MQLVFNEETAYLHELIKQNPIYNERVIAHITAYENVFGASMGGGPNELYYGHIYAGSTLQLFAGMGYMATVDGTKVPFKVLFNSLINPSYTQDVDGYFIGYCVTFQPAPPGGDD